MVKILQFGSRANLHEDAALWVARLDRGISADERETLRQWLADNPQRRAALFELAELWDALDVLAELAELFPLAQPTPRAHQPATFRWAAAISSGAVVAAVGLWLYGDASRDHATATVTSPVAQTLKEDLQTVIGGREVRTLPDGSVVTLNTDTELAVDYSEDSRDVFLKRGEANFSVARDETKPFRVHVGDRIVQAVGTAFNVQLRPSGAVEVTVSEGKVKVSRSLSVVPERPELVLDQADLQDATLNGGEAVLLGAIGAAGSARPQISRLEPIDMGVKLAWQHGMLIFQGEALETVLAEVSRYASVKFVLADDALATVRVGGYFRTGDIDGLLVALRENFAIESAVEEDSRIVLSSRH